jgi:hypothetical protein
MDRFSEICKSKVVMMHSCEMQAHKNELVAFPYVSFA